MPIDRDDWSQLKVLFNTALDSDIEARAEFIDRAGKEYPHLIEQLRALVEAHDQGSGVLDQAALDEDLTRPASDLGNPDIDPGMMTAGDVLDHTYEIEGTLGHGGMGVVYRVRHRGLSRSFAAKLIHARAAEDQEFLERFSREAEALGKLRHPNIVDVTDFGVDRGEKQRPFLVMEYLEGRTLEAHLRDSPSPLDDILPVLEEIAAALDHAHEQGVLHLDLKPANVFMVVGRDGRARPKILDFGLARFLAIESGDRAHAAERLIGTPAYMAPELLDGAPPGVTADIYSFGVLMYTVAVGRQPFEGTTAEILEQLRRGATPPQPSSVNPAIPSEADRALVAALGRQPSNRPPTARAAVALVRHALLGAKQRQWRRTEVPRRLGAASLIALLLTSVFVMWPPRIVRTLEHRTVDARFALSEPRPPSPAIVLLLVDEATLRADPTPIIERADQFGRDIQRVFAAGARGVGVDFLLPASWGSSLDFSQLVLRHSDRLALAAFSTAQGEVIGPECISGVTTVALGPERASSLFGFINLDEDADAVSRRARRSYRDRDGIWRPSFAARAASLAHQDSGDRRDAPDPAEFWIDHTIDPARFERISWVDLDQTLRTRPAAFQDRLVVVGADYAGSGDVGKIPNRGAIPGVLLHALIAETILSNYPVREVGKPLTAVAAAVTCALLCAALLLARSTYRSVAAVIAVAAAHVALAITLFVYAKLLIATAGPLLLLGTAAALALAVRRVRPSFPER